LGVALVATVAASGALHAVRAAPEPKPSGSVLPARVAAGKAFAPVCKANELGDTRPDPAWVGASFEHDNCWAPRLPAPLNGATASREQIVAGMAAEKKYLAMSDAYQKCIGDFVVFRKTRAKKPVSAALILIETHRILAAEKNEQRAANQIKVAINAFNEYGSECPDH
jgi:hypothetical protein